jgi:hypothetical protein
MSVYLLAAVVALGAQQPAPGTANQDRTGGQTAMTGLLDGQWTVVYFESHGHQAQAGSNATVTIHGGTLTFMRDGRQHTMHLNFGPNNTLTVSGMGEGHEGTGRGQTQGAPGTPGETGNRPSPRLGGGNPAPGAANPATQPGQQANRQGQAQQGNPRNAQGSQGTAQGTQSERPYIGLLPPGQGPAAGGQGRGPQGMASRQSTHHGVYIWSQEYLCLCLTGDQAMGGNRGGQGAQGRTPIAPTAGRPGTAGVGGTGSTGGTTGAGASGGHSTATGTAQGGPGVGHTPGTGVGQGGAGVQPQTAAFVLILRKHQAGSASR